MPAPKRKTPYVSTNLTVPARDAWTRATLEISAHEGRRITQSAVLLAALEVARQYPDAFKTALTTIEDGDSE